MIRYPTSLPTPRDTKKSLSALSVVSTFASVEKGTRTGAPFLAFVSKQHYALERVLPVFPEHRMEETDGEALKAQATEDNLGGSEQGIEPEEKMTSDGFMIGDTPPEVSPGCMLITLTVYTALYFIALPFILTITN